MKFCQITYWISLLLTATASLFVSCSSDDDYSYNQPVSDTRLLPIEIVTEYNNRNKLVNTYRYDNDNRLTEYTESRYFGNDIAREDMETICKISYNAKGEVDTLIIIPRLLNDNENINSKISELASDTITFGYQGQHIQIKRKDERKEEVFVNPKGEVTSYKYCSPLESEKLVTVLYQYDNKGNIAQIISRDSQLNETITNYSYDKQNGIFRCVNTPQWFLVIMLNLNFDYQNNCKKYTGYQDGLLDMVYEYNNDGYPVFYKRYFEGNTKVNLPEQATSIEYVEANKD